MKKAQLQIMENVFILLIIFFILIIAFIFVVMLQSGEQKKKLDEIHTLELIKKSQVLNFLPEMQCSDNNNLNPDCYDLLKIFSFQEKLQEERYKSYYKTLLGDVYINIIRFDPSPEIPDDKRVVFDIVLYDSPKPKSSGYKEVQFPVLLK